MEKEIETVVLRDVVPLDEDLWKKIKMEEFDRKKRSQDPLNITSYPICILNKNRLKEIELLSFKGQKNLFFDITSAPLEIKVQLEQIYGVKAEEKAIVPSQKTRTMSLLYPTATCFIDGRLTKEEKKQLGSEYVLVKTKENGYEITKHVSHHGYNEEIADQVFLSVNLSELSPALLDKIIESVETFVPNENGYYDYVKRDEDIKEVGKAM